MAKARLLQAICTVAMLAAVPAFAQQTTGPGQGATGDSTMTTPSGAPAANPGSMNNGSMAQSGMSDQGNGSMAPMPGHARMHNGMGHSRRAMRGGATDSSQNATVDQLNDQSLRAAQQGRTFSAASDTGAMGGSAASSGTMNDMSGGSMSGGSMSSGSPSGSGAMSGGTPATGSASGMGGGAGGSGGR